MPTSPSVSSWMDSYMLLRLATHADQACEAGRRHSVQVGDADLIVHAAQASARLARPPHSCARALLGCQSICLCLLCLPAQITDNCIILAHVETATNPSAARALKQLYGLPAEVCHPYT